MSAEDNKTTEQLEQVPLKTDTETAPEVPVEEPPKVKKAWFTWGKKKTAETNIELAAELEAQNQQNGEEKPKKQCWWSKTFGKSEAEQKENNISIGINLVNRDEKNINNHVHFNFEDIFGEPDSQHSWDFVWTLVFKVFSCTKQFFYRLFSFIIGIPAAIIFAIFFAFFTVINVFACVPAAKLLSIPATWIAKAWNWLIHAVFDPIFGAIGLVFSSFTIRKYGINNSPTEPLV